MEIVKLAKDSPDTLDKKDDDEFIENLKKKLQKSMSPEYLMALRVALSRDEPLVEHSDAACQTRAHTKNKGVTCIPETKSVGTSNSEDPTSSAAAAEPEKLVRDKCIVCLNAEACMMYWPCRHIAVCDPCSRRWTQWTCPMCQGNSKKCFLVYFTGST